MNKIYVITSGDYSDYHIITVMSSMKKAKEFKEYYEKTQRYDSVEIEVYNIDQWLFQARNSLFPWYVEMYSDGETLKAEKLTYIPNNINQCYIITPMKKKYIKLDPRPDWKEMDKNFNEYFFPGLLTYIFAEDKKHAVKIANEKRTALLAYNMFPSSAEEIRQTTSKAGPWVTFEEYNEMTK